MENPFYVEPGSNILAEPTRQAIQLLQLKQQSQLGQVQLSQKERHYQGELPLRTMQAETAKTQAGTARIGAKTAGMQADIAQQKLDVEGRKTQHLDPFTASENIERTLKMKSAIGEKAMECLSPITSGLRTFSFASLTKGQTAMSVVDPKFLPRIKKSAENLEKYIEKMESLEDGETGWAETPQGQMTKQIYNILASDKKGLNTQKILFGPTMAAIEAEKFEREIERSKAGPTLTGDIGQFSQMMGRKPGTVGELKEFKEGTRPEPQTTVSERDILKRQKATEELTLMAQKDPNAVCEHGYKMNADKTLYIDPVDKAPVKLPHFTKVMGKRGGPKMAKAAGEFWDDTVEIQELLNDPEVIKNLQWAEKEGFWDRVKGSWSNKINLWLTKKGFSKDSKTTEAIVRIQRLASIERLKFLGSAVTATELESILPWLPSAGDSFSIMTTKMGVAAKEGEEVFRRYLEMYQDICDMSPFYKAFGIKRFPDETNNIDALKNKYGLE